MPSGFVGLGIQTASDRQAQTLEDWFGVELLTVTAADGTQVPVVRTEEGDYIDAASLIQVYYGERLCYNIYSAGRQNHQRTHIRSYI